MVSVDQALEQVKSVHPLDNVAPEGVGDVLTRVEIERHLSVQKRIVALNRIRMKLTFEMAELLKLVRDERMYKTFGHSSFEDWLNVPEVEIDRSTAYRYIKILEGYVLTGAFTKEELYGQSISKLEILLPYVTPTAKDWDDKKSEIEGMLELSRVDLTIHLNEKMDDTRYTPERPSQKALVTKGRVTDATFEEVSNAKKNSVEAHVGDTPPKSKRTADDAAFDDAVKPEATVETRKVVSTADAKKEFGIGGWYKLVPVDSVELKGKKYLGVTLHAATIGRVNGEIYMDIE